MISGLRVTDRTLSTWPLYFILTLSPARKCKHKRQRRCHLLVAPMIKTFFLLVIPSISVKIWLMTPVSRTSCISSPATSCFSNRVQLVKEQNAWGRLPCLIPQQHKQCVIYITMRSGKLKIHTRSTSGTHVTTKYKLQYVLAEGC